MRPASGSLPGFSGRFDDESATGVGGARVAHSSVDELADLSILGARLQKEKLRIQETARARRRPLVQVSCRVLSPLFLTLSWLSGTTVTSAGGRVVRQGALHAAEKHTLLARAEIIDTETFNSEGKKREANACSCVW